MGKLTKKQINVFNAIKSYIDKHEYPPTTRELCSILGLSSTSTVFGHLEKLKGHGLVDWKEGQPRTIKILKEVNHEKSAS